MGRRQGRDTRTGCDAGPNGVDRPPATHLKYSPSFLPIESCTATFFTNSDVYCELVHLFDDQDVLCSSSIHLTIHLCVVDRETQRHARWKTLLKRLHIPWYVNRLADAELFSLFKFLQPLDPHPGAVSGNSWHDPPFSLVMADGSRLSTTRDHSACRNGLKGM